MVQDKKKLVTLAMEGDKDALEMLIRSIQNRIFGLSLKMLYQPSDAEDATQEILIKIVTRLESFRQESTFDTWAMKIASNHLLNKQKNLTKLGLTELFLKTSFSSSQVNFLPKISKISS